MCSIYGIMYYNGCKTNILQEKMTKMYLKTKHRGPDENEIQYFDGAAIGMNRLAIIAPNDNNDTKK